MASLRQITFKIARLDRRGYGGLCREKYHTYNNTEVEFDFTYLFFFMLQAVALRLIFSLQKLNRALFGIINLLFATVCSSATNV